MTAELFIPVAAVFAAIGIVLVMFFAWKGRPFADGDVFRASRWSRWGGGKYAQAFYSPWPLNCSDVLTAANV